MAAVTHVCSIDYVAKMLGEDAELLEAIIYNEDNLTYGNIVSVYVGPDETVTALTDDGIEELTDMIRNARITNKTWHEFLDDFEPPRVYRRAKLSENCPLWNRHQRRRPRSRIHPSSASVRFGWSWSTAMIIRAKQRR